MACAHKPRCSCSCSCIKCKIESAKTCIICENAKNGLMCVFTVCGLLVCFTFACCDPFLGSIMSFILPVNIGVAA